MRKISKKDLTFESVKEKTISARVTFTLNAALEKEAFELGIKKTALARLILEQYFFAKRKKD